jgi:hypothetical protein
MTPVAYAAGPGPQEVTDVAARVGWVVALVLLVALVYWLMREGWRWRATLQADLPPLPAVPGTDPDDESTPRMTGTYHGTTTAGQWLDRIVAHGLGARSRAELALTPRGVAVARTGAPDFLVPAERIRGARLERGIAGKVLTEGGLLVITRAHGERMLDSGFRSDHAAADHPAWTEALDAPGALDEFGALTHARPTEGAR